MTDSDWRPIETAPVLPQGKGMYLIAFKGGSIMIGRVEPPSERMGGRKMFDTVLVGDGRKPHREGTPLAEAFGGALAWMPLPEPPKC